MKSLQAIVATGALCALVASPVLAQTSGSGATTAPGQSSQMTQPRPGETPGSAQPGATDQGTRPDQKGTTGMSQPSSPSGTGTLTERPGDTGRSQMKDAAGAMEKDNTAGGKKMNASQVRKVQEALKARGMDPGPIDGIFGPRTRQALRDFQKQESIAETGQLNRETLEKLGVSEA
jgi:hypothetical protein